MLRGLQTLNNSAPAPQIRCADQGYDCQDCASQGGNCYNNQNMEQCCNDNGCTWDKSSPQQCGSRHSPSQGGSVTGVDAAKQCLQTPSSDINTVNACCVSACNNDAQCIGHCQSIVSGQEPSPDSGPDDCPSAYFDQNMIPNFAGSCNNSNPGGYVDCCRCGGMSGGIGQCPPGCSDMGGDCVPNGGSPPSPPSPPQPSPPQPSPPPPSPSSKKSCESSSDCGDGMFCLFGSCHDTPSKWTKDFYDKYIKHFVDEFKVDKERAECVVSNLTKKFPNPLKIPFHMDEVKDMISQCKSRQLSTVAPQLYNEGGTNVKSDNTKKILLIVGIILLVLALLVLGGVMIHEHNKK